MEKRLVFHLSEEAQKMVGSACKQIIEQMGESTKNPFSETERERAIYEANTEIERREECESAKREAARLKEENAFAVDSIEKQIVAKICLRENLQEMADLKNKYKKERDAAQNELEETTANYRELLGKKNAENQAQKAEIDRLNGLLKVQEEQAAKTHEAYERAVEDIRGRKKMNIDDFFHVWVGKEWFAIEANKLNSPRRVFGYCECIADGFALMKTLSRELGGYEIEAITATDIPTSKEPGILLILNMPIDKLKEL